MKLKLDGVAETLFITLYIRAKDAMSDKPILNDKLSLEIMEKIDYLCDGAVFGALNLLLKKERQAGPLPGYKGSRRAGAASAAPSLRAWAMASRPSKIRLSTSS